MTKKPSVKNREWEKERRDRLNAAMDKLGLLLPHCSPSTPPSKIEIVLRAIQIVEELQRQVRDLLAGSHASILKSQLELEESIRMLLLRNEALHTLLKKAKITAPPFTPPKAVGSFRMPPPAAADTATPTETTAENNGNNINVQPAGRPPKHSQLIGVGAHTNGTTTTTASNARKTTTISTQTTAIPPARLIRLPILQSGGGSGAFGPLMLVRQQMPGGKSVHRLVRPKTGTAELTASMATNGKVAIPALKRRHVRAKVRHKRIRKKLQKVAVEEMEKPTTDGDLNSQPNADKIKRVADADDEMSAIPACKRPKPIERSDAVSTDVIVQKPDDIYVFKTPDPPPHPASTTIHNDPHLEHFDPSYPASAALARPVDLSQDILDDLHVPQHESNPESLSPTAAFLLSFPVVSARPDDPTAPIATNINDCQQQQQQQQHSILENITTLLTTKDYERFVEDVAKTEQNLSGGAASEVEHKSPEPKSKTKSYNKYAVSSNKKPDAALKPRRLDSHQAFAAQLPGQLSNFGMEPPRFSAVDTAPFTFSLTSTCSTAAITAAATSTLKPLGFYDSLSNIGSGSRHVPASTATTVGTFTPNLYSNALSLASSSTNVAHKTLVSNYSMDTPFTFSLTTSTNTLATMPPAYQSQTNDTTQSYLVSTHTKSTANDNSFGTAPIPLPALTIPQQPNNFLPADTGHTFGGQSVTYNPFAFDNVPGIMPATQPAPATQFTFSLTSSTQTPTKTTPTTSQHHRYASDPSASLNTNNSYSMIPYNFYTDANKSSTSTRSTNLPFSVCSAVTPKPAVIVSATTTAMPSRPTNDSANKPNCAATVASTGHHQQQPQQQQQQQQQHTAAKPHVNWMTSTSSAGTASSSQHTSAAAINGTDFNPTIPPSHEYTPAYYPTPKPADLMAYVPPLLPAAAAAAAAAPVPVPVHALPDDTFVWSPNKLLDASAASSTLPTLHGDLALNNFGAHAPAAAAAASRAHFSAKRTDKATTSAANEKNSFSVSHLVEQRKPPSNKHLVGSVNKQQHGVKATEDASSGDKSFVHQHQTHYQQYPAASSAVTSASAKPISSSSSSSGGHSNAYSTEALLSSSSNHQQPHHQQCRNSMFATSSANKQRPDVKALYSHKHTDCYNANDGGATNNTMSTATAPVALDKYVPSVGDSAYNYYPTSYLANQSGNGSGYQQHQHQHSETDYLGATTSVATQKHGAGGYANQQQHHQEPVQQQQQQQQLPTSTPSIPHAYPFNNTANTSSGTITSRHNHQHYSNNYKCVGDIASGSGSTTSSRRSHQVQYNQHSQHPNETSIHRKGSSAANNYNFQPQMLPTIVSALAPPPSSAASLPPASSSYDHHYRTDDSIGRIASTNYPAYQEHNSAVFTQHHQHRPAAAAAAGGGGGPSATVQHPSFGWAQHHAHGTTAAAVHSGAGQHYGGGPHHSIGGASNSSGLVSNFNLSTICPEINNEKGNNW